MWAAENSTVTFFKTNLKAFDYMIMVRLAGSIQLLKLILGKGYSHQMWVAETLRHSSQVERLWSRDFDVHSPNKPKCITNSYTDICQLYFQKTASV